MSRAPVDIEPTSSPTDERRTLTRPTALWHAWLGTLNGRAGRKRALAPPPDHEPSWSAEELTLGAAFGPAEVIEWQGLWLATQRRPWSSLAVIPGDKSISTPRIARALAEVGLSHLGPTTMVADGTTVTLAQLQASVDAWIERRKKVQRVLIALGPVLENPAGLALARAADAAILCLRLGDSVSQARRTIEEIGRERFLGSILLRRSEEDR